ncbi:alpha/beta fold hydrolase [Myxococcus landrumensis]|uniref:Alpha/beta hydrolase n=1 Tax=Myxococcus landrumensis TaxID=2813577 RepID=A0ABX7NE78_9BACT|nr:alpha/beta hydrolase [Myxococcus landrumus]QSQ17090.1 alpha/beta hydrolase [Myxococcus landrumus]
MNSNLAARILVGVLMTVMAPGCASTSAHASTGAASSRGAYAQVHGLNMYYEAHGPPSGRPLVLLHGGGSTIHTTFGKLLPLVARNRRVIGVEQQAHGHTADIDRPLSFEQMADDTAALLQQLDIPDADIMGFSSGGVVAMQMALRHPRLVHSLILASTHSTRDGCYSYMWEGFPRATLDAMPAALREAYLQASGNPEGLQVLFQKTVTMMMGFKDLDSEALRKVTVPTLIMTADGDVIRPEHSVELLRLFPRAQLAIFPGAVHGSYMGAAEFAEHKPTSQVQTLTAVMIDEFLNEHR